MKLSFKLKNSKLNYFKNIIQFKNWTNKKNSQNINNFMVKLQSSNFKIMRRKKMNLEKFIRDVNDFPKPGIIYKDITPALKNPETFKYIIDKMAEIISEWNFDVVIGPESRGFIFAAPVAYKLNKELIPVRKPGKLPYKTLSVSYDLEYGSTALEIHVDAVEKGKKVVIVDDVLATGGTLEAIVKLVEKSGGEVVGIISLAELTFLNPREKFKGIKIESLINY